MLALAPLPVDAIANVEITPEIAQELLGNLELLQASADGQGQNGVLYEQMQEALQEIAGQGESVEAAELVETLPAMQGIAEAERPPVLHRMLAWMQAAIDKQKEPLQPVVAVSDTPDATTTSLQAALFSAGDDAAAPALEADEGVEITNTPQTITQVVPLAYTQAVPLWVQKLSEGESNVVSPEIDAAIPALTLPRDEPESLPQVNLPKAPGYGERAPEQAAPVTTAKKSEQLQALSEHLSADEATATPVTQPVGNAAIMLPKFDALIQHSMATNAAHGYAALHHTPAAEQVQVAITTAVRDGLDHITMQLEPADLGRVEIRMDIAQDGRTQIAFLADRSDTLDALSRDAHALERALHEAGIRADAGSMQFNLRQQAQQEFSGPDGEKGSAALPALANAAGAVAAAADIGGITKHYTINVEEGVDIRA